MTMAGAHNLQPFRSPSLAEVTTNLKEWRRQFDLEMCANLLRARKEAGLTQAELGYRCGIDAAKVCRWESGALVIAASYLALVASALGVPPMSLWPKY
jgi:DNA-binding transcriptional regulator YiaG